MSTQIWYLVFSEPLHTLFVASWASFSLPRPRYLGWGDPLLLFMLLSCSQVRAKSEAWIPGCNLASGNFGEAPNDCSLPFWAFRVRLGLSVLGKPLSPLLTLQRSLFHSREGYSSLPFSLHHLKGNPINPIKHNALILHFLLLNTVHSSPAEH